MHFGDHFTQASDGVCAENDVDIRRPFQYARSKLLCHASADADEQPGTFSLQTGHTTEKAEHFLFGFLPDRTGVDNNQVRFCSLSGLRIVQRCQLLFDPAGVINVHLAADGLYVEFFCAHFVDPGTPHGPNFEHGSDKRCRVSEWKGSALVHIFGFDHHLPPEILQNAIYIRFKPGGYVQRNDPSAGIDGGQRRDPVIRFENEFQEGDLPAINPVISADGFH